MQQITFLYTDNLETTAEFYEEKVGLELKLDQGSCRIYTVNDGAFVGFCTRQSGPSPAGVIFTLVTDDVDGFCDELSGRGVEFEEPPNHNDEYDIHHAFFRDPNGYLIEVQRFDDPRW